jgi:hypothetical protein
MATPGAAPDFSIKCGDRKPSLRATLSTRNTDGTTSAVSLTGATVEFRLKAPGARAAKVSRAAVVENAASGIVRFDWAAGDTDTARPDYRAEFRVTFADSTTETFPSRGYLTIEIEEALD